MAERASASRGQRHQSAWHALKRNHTSLEGAVPRRQTRYLFSATGRRSAQRAGERVKLTLRADRPYERLDIRHTSGLTPAQVASLRALGALGEEGDESAGQ